MPPGRNKAFFAAPIQTVSGKRNNTEDSHRHSVIARLLPAVSVEIMGTESTDVHAHERFFMYKYIK